MFQRPLLAVLFPLLSAATNGRDIVRELDLPRPAIVMFWAEWCAPCRAELRDYDALSRAAAPYPLVVVALDSPASARILLGGVRADRLRFARRPSIDVLMQWPRDAAGLPFAVAFDRQGRSCALHNGGLNISAIAAMRRRCADPPIPPPATPPPGPDRPTPAG